MEPFFTTKEQGKGTGLVTRHGARSRGAVRRQTDHRQPVGSGTTVAPWLPQAATAGAAAGNDHRGRGAGEKPCSPRLLAVGEDQPGRARDRPMNWRSRFRCRAGRAWPRGARVVRAGRAGCGAHRPRRGQAPDRRDRPDRRGTPPLAPPAGGAGDRARRRRRPRSGCRRPKPAAHSPWSANWWWPRCCWNASPGCSGRPDPVSSRAGRQETALSFRGEPLGGEWFQQHFPAKVLLRCPPTATAGSDGR